MGSNFLTRRSAVKVLGGAGLSILGSGLIGCSQKNGSDSNKAGGDSPSPKVITPKAAIESDQKTVWFCGDRIEYMVGKESADSSTKVAVKNRFSSINGFEDGIFCILGQNSVVFYDSILLIDLNEEDYNKRREQFLSFGDIAKMSDEELVKKIESSYSEPLDGKDYKLTLCLDDTGNKVEGELIEGAYVGMKSVGDNDHYHTEYDVRRWHVVVKPLAYSFGVVYDVDFFGYQTFVGFNGDGPYSYKDSPESDRCFFVRIPKDSSSKYSFELDAMDSGIEVK